MAETGIQIPISDLDKLLGHADGNAALLYLHIRRAGSFSLSRAARELKCTEMELLAAAATLRSLGLMAQDESRAETPETPEYTAADIAARAKTDAAFEAVVREAERALGHVLSSNDLRLLFGIYDYWGLQPDVIMELLHHCVEQYQLRHGAGRKPTMRYVETEAQFWVRNEINTLDAADEYITREKRRQEDVYRVQETLQIRSRNLTASERNYIESWLALGFGPDALAIAYDRTMISTGRLTWKYMDKIIHSWDEKHLHTPEEIEVGDARRTDRRTAPPQEPPQTDGDKLDVMRRMYARMKEKNHDD
ncbi:MAG: DnaD domain protein [Oscillospiraceae bacterium]|nr:DnaD domain protein [Oscillospiraceae bacterium]